MEGEDPDQTMFGETQLSWFLHEIRKSEATWKIWVDEVLTVPLKLGTSRATVYPVTTGWDGFMRERQRIMTNLSQWDVSNFSIFTGDMHCYLAGDQQTTYADALSNFVTGAAETNNRVGVELMTPALTSLNIAEEIGANRGPLSNVTEDLLSRAVCAQNPHIEFFNSHH
jgi:alkaline phosphatase D